MNFLYPNQKNLFDISDDIFNVFFANDLENIYRQRTIFVDSQSNCLSSLSAKYI